MCDQSTATCTRYPLGNREPWWNSTFSLSTAHVPLKFPILIRQPLIQPQPLFPPSHSLAPASCASLRVCRNGVCIFEEQSQDDAWLLANSRIMSGGVHRSSTGDVCVGSRVRPRASVHLSTTNSTTSPVICRDHERLTVGHQRMAFPILHRWRGLRTTTCRANQYSGISEFNTRKSVGVRGELTIRDKRSPYGVNK